MSSSDAITHGASVSIGRDIVLPLKPDMPERTQLWIMRVSVVLVGGVAYYLAIFGGEGLIQLLLGAYGYIVQFAPPVYGALYWRRATREGALAGLVAGVAVNCYYQLLADATPYDINAGMVALIANIAVFVGISLLVRQSDEIRSRSAAFVET